MLSASLNKTFPSFLILNLLTILNQTLTITQNLRLEGSRKIPKYVLYFFCLYYLNFYNAPTYFTSMVMTRIDARLLKRHQSPDNLNTVKIYIMSFGRKTETAAIGISFLIPNGRVLFHGQCKWCLCFYYLCIIYQGIISVFIEIIYINFLTDRTAHGT